MAEALEVQIKADAASFIKGIQQAIAGMDRLTAQGKAAGTRLDQISKSTQTLANGMKAFGIGIAAAIGSQVIGSLQQLGAEFIKLAEAPTKFKSSLEALTGSSSRAENMLQRVYDVAKRTGTGFDDTAALVQKLTIGLNSLGANNAQIAQIAENILKLGTIGGSSIADTAAAAQQLSQALASGKLQGDELRSILERMPTMAQLIAKEMGVSVGELKKLGAEGKITSDIIANSLLKATQQINADFAKMPLTVAQAMNNVKTSIQQAFDNPAAKASVQALANTINLIPKAIQQADLAVRQFMNGLRSFGNSMANAFEPVTRTLTKMTDGFSNLASIIGPALAPIKNILYVAFIGPLAAIISNWDNLIAYFTNKVPQMFYTMAGAAREGMAAVLSIFSDGFAKLVDIAGRAINAIIDALNFMGSKVNAAFNAFGNAIGIGSTDIIGKIDPIKLEFEGLNNTIVGMQVAAKDNFAKAGQYAQKYATDLRTIARTAAETASAAEAGTAKWEDYNKALDKVAASAGDASSKGGGGGKGGGGAAGGIKKAGDAAKKAAEQMDAAKSQVEEFGQAMQSIAQSLGSGVVDALFSIADGSKSAKEAFSELAKSMLKQIAQMVVQLLILKPLMGMFGGGFGLLGGVGGGLLRSAPSTRAFHNPMIGDYAGFRSTSYSGFSGISRSSLSSISTPTTHQAPMNVTVNNNSSAVVKTRQDQGGLTIDVIEDVVSDRIMRGGNKIDAAMQRAFGARRVGY